MALGNGLRGFIGCTLIATILQYVIGVNLGAVYRLMKVMDVAPGSTFDNFATIQQATWLIGWMALLIFFAGVIWLIISIFNREPMERY